MTATSNIFTNPPSLTSDEALERLRHQLTPKESYYCTPHLVDLVDAQKNKNFSVGSTKRYLIVQSCVICGYDAQFVVAD